MAADNGGQRTFMPMLSLDMNNPVLGTQPKLLGVKQGGDMFGSVDIYLQAGEEVVCDYGSLLWMDSEANMMTSLYGDCMSACGRSCAGESMCMNTYTHPNGGIIGVGMVLPGDIISCYVAKDLGWCLSKGAFVAGSTNLRISGRFAGCCASQLSGEGAFLTKVTLIEGEEGPGIFWAGSYGAIDRHVVQGGQCLEMDNGMFFAGPQTVKLGIKWVGGVKSACFSGEGLVMSVWGPTVLYTQNRDPSIFTPPEDPSQGNTVQ